MRMQPHGLGIDRHRNRCVAGQIGQIAAMQADGHGVSVPRRIGGTKLALKIVNKTRGAGPRSSPGCRIKITVRPPAIENPSSLLTRY